MRRPTRKHVGCLVAIGLGCVLAGLFLTGVAKVRQASVRTMCLSNAKHIGLSAHDYWGRWKVFPPGTVVSDLPVEQRLSWLLPALDGWGDRGRGQADASRPWDDEKNRAVTGEVIKSYRCRIVPDEDPRPITTYAGVTGVGPDSPTLPDTHPRAGFFAYDRGTPITAFRDGLSNTIMFVEYGREFVPWAKGGVGTLTWFDPADPPYRGMPHGGGWSPFGRGARCGLVGFGDGSSRLLADTVSPHILEAMATIAGGEAVAFPE